MIDLADIKARIAAMPDEGDQTVVTRSYLEQLLAELTAGRAAQASLQRIDAHIGQTFGLGGRTL